MYMKNQDSFPLFASEKITLFTYRLENYYRFVYFLLLLCKGNVLLRALPNYITHLPLSFSVSLINSNFKCPVEKCTQFC